MHDALKEENIVDKVGGRFKLSTLIQKRLVALNRGARPLLEIPTKNHMEVVIQEILHDKIYLDESGEAAVREEAGTGLSDVVPDDAGPSLEDMS